MTSSTLVTDYVGRGTAAARPVTPNIPAGATALYYATDTAAASLWNGSAWVSVATGSSAGGLFSQAIGATPTSTSTGLSTWQNQGSATITDSAAGLYLSCVSNGGADGLRMRTKAISGSRIYTGLLALNWDWTAADIFGGFGFTDGTKSQLLLIASRQGGSTGPGMYIINYSSNTVQNSVSFTSATSIRSPLVIWLQLEIDATKVYYRTSQNGTNFREIYSVALASGYLGATGYSNLALALNPYNVAGDITLMSYAQT